MVQLGGGLRSKLEGAGLTQSKPYLNRRRRLDLVTSVVSQPKKIRIKADSLLASSLKHDRDADAKPCHNQKK